MGPYTRDAMSRNMRRVRKSTSPAASSAVPTKTVRPTPAWSTVVAAETHTSTESSTLIAMSRRVWSAARMGADCAPTCRHARMSRMPPT